jgi:transcription antitermination factor NusG
MARRRDKPKMTKAKAYKPKVTIVNGRTRTETKNPPPSDLDLDPKTKWYLVYTAPRMEAKAKQALEDAGCKTFWPSSHVVITAPRRKPVEHDVGTFPRYLFVSGMPFRERQIDRVQEDRTVVTVNGRPVDDIRDIDGVLEVVSNSAGWLRVPNAAIAAIAGYQASKIEERRAPTVRPGDKARVIEGPFMSFQATVVEAIGMDAAKVLIDIFGGKVPVTMPLAQLDAA